MDKIASTISQPFQIYEGESKTISMEIIPTVLVPDEYCLSIEIIQFNDGGSYYSFDNPEAMIPFKIVESNALLKWSTQYWGHVRLPEMKLITFE